MDLHAELARLNAAPELPEWVVGTVQKLIDQAQQEAAEAVRLSEQITRRDTELHAAKTKIQALTLELVHLRRMRYGARSEAFSVEERDLFQDTLASDLAAAEAELAKKQAEAATTEPQAPRPPRPRAGRQPLPDHLPLYRLEQIAARDRVILSRTTMAEWVGRIGVALQPLADRLAELLLERTVLHADETPVAQLDPGRGKTKRAYLWVYRSNVLETGPPIVVFDYQASRSGKHARNFLLEWQGHLMVDDYSGYKALFTEGVTELACLVHARRKFFDLNEAQPNSIAQEALNRIAALYAIEAQGQDMTPEERTTLRQEQAQPLLQSLHDWLLQTRVTVANGGGTAKAIDYSLRCWVALSRYATDGRLPIDNNPVANVIRPIALGRKNWLFTGSERAGQRAAAIQTLLGTAKLNGLDPAAWLRDTLDRLPTCLNSLIDSLLPLRSQDMRQTSS